MNELVSSIEQMYGLENVKSVFVNKISEIPFLKEYSADFKKHVHKNVQMKGCFRNAYLTMSYFYKKGVEVGYCEGFVGLNLGGQILPIEHAWNSFKYEGKEYYLDITSDVIFDSDIGKGNKDYILIFESNDLEDIKSYITKNVAITKCFQEIRKRRSKK